jgi:hypothetical protein
LEQDCNATFFENGEVYKARAQTKYQQFERNEEIYNIYKKGGRETGSDFQLLLDAINHIVLRGFAQAYVIS